MKSQNRTIEERNRLVNENLGLVYSCANRFRGRGAEFEDLVQSGCIGLVKASEGFDETKGFKFSTYAVPAIIGEMKRIFRDGGTVKVGRSDKEKARKLQILQDEMAGVLGRSPTVGELAEKTGYSLEYTSQLLCASMPVLSLTMGDDESSESIQTDIAAVDTTEEMGDIIALKTALDCLSERDREIVELRYFRGLTQTVTAEKLGMTQVQVSRREKTVLLSLKKKLSG
ncbi:MAG: sigma-70 family RNA polymerase sigma factor [Clostridiales bacterium]|nr:sigma-70 family RNA polymerase sigma factor [Clostridiales bacterium]